MQGETIPRERIIAAIDEAGEKAHRVTGITYGYFRKALIEFETANGRQKIAKAAFHPVSIAMLKNEYTGLSAAGRPPQTISLQSDGVAVLVVDRLEGRPGRRLTYFNQIVPPFISPVRAIAQDDFLARFAVDDRSTWRDERIAQARDILGQVAPSEIPMGPSHGDFVYWNCLRAGERTHVIDFEAFSDARIASYDLWYWHILPVVRTAVRLGKPAVSASLIAAVAPTIWKQRILRADPSLSTMKFGPQPAWIPTLVLMLIEHGMGMAVENRMPDIVELIGTDALTLRRKVCVIYDLIISRILGKR